MYVLKEKKENPENLKKKKFQVGTYKRPGQLTGNKSISNGDLRY